MVLLFHVAASTGYLTRQGALPSLLSRGEIGVPIFFTLSGLLLYRPWAAAALGLRPAPGTGGYLWKRALRLLPAYWALVVVTMVMYAEDHLTDIWTWLSLATLTYSYDPHPWWNNYLGPNGMGQIWSLTVEAAFYVALPFLAFLLRLWAKRAGEDVGARARRLLYGLGGYSLISMVYALGVSYTSNEGFYGNWLPRYLIWFAIGMALAVVSVWAHAESDQSPAGEGDRPVGRFCRTVAASWGMCWITAALLYCVSSTPLTGVSRFIAASAWTTELHIVLYGLVAAFLIAPVALAPADHPATRQILGNRVMAFLGKISYSVFLWQFVVIYVWFDITNHPPFTGNLLVDFPVCTLLTVGVSTLSYYLIESPVRRLGTRRRTSVRRQPVGDGVPG
ncbi:acyltransferase [Actinomadura rudentiformis]|uniref:Acyltransferase n=2 Tax=Actinomadura rudentiformis TaxID=359158 RepID=A0A6H9Z9K2_9ACTN|nr:acyltransferase [Actinomadura rudentiformis]